MKYKKICITGADGFIGSHLAEYCILRGYDVRAFCFYNSFGHRGWLENSPLVDQMDIFLGDIRDSHTVYTAIRGCEAVLHLAALIAIPYSYHAPESYVDTNIKGTLNVLQAARELEIARVVHTSTSEVYGSARFVPITEAHPLHGQSPYAATKIGADQLALSFYKSFNTPVAVFRPFNTYGPRQSTRAVIPSIITQLLTCTTEIQLGSLHPTRDFSYIDDTVSAFESVLTADTCVGEVVNGGSGFEISIGELAQLTMKLMDTQATVVCEQQRLRPAASEVERLFADNSKLKELTNWRPLYEGREGFIQGLEKTVRWFTNKENIAQYSSKKYIL